MGAETRRERGGNAGQRVSRTGEGYIFALCGSIGPARTWRSRRLPPGDGSQGTISEKRQGGTRMRMRRNVKYLSTSEKDKFVSAVLALKSKPRVLHSGDATRNRYDDYPEVHMNAMMADPGWAHRGPAFFPWHRFMLLAFEDDL